MFYIPIHVGILSRGIYTSLILIAFDAGRTLPNTDLTRDFMDLSWVDGSWDAHLASPADFFAGARDITKEREPGIEIIECTP